MYVDFFFGRVCISNQITVSVDIIIFILRLDRIAFHTPISCRILRIHNARASELSTGYEWSASEESAVTHY